jgi:putative acetyltransferase
VQLRAEEEPDHGEVASVVTAAFGDSGTTIATLVDELRGLVTVTSGCSLVADDDGDVVGHVMLTRSLLDAPRQLVDVLVLSPLAVRPSHQRQGVGSQLVLLGLQRADEMGAPAVFLEGSPDYYSRLGFLPGEPLGFRKPSLRIPDAAFQVVRLSAYEPWMTGTLVYSELFWRFDAVGLRDEDAEGR